MRLRIATTVQQKPLTMFYTYISRSIEHPEQRYIGHTADLRERLKKHNKGDVPHTAKFRPWKVETYFAFESEENLLLLNTLSNPAAVTLSPSGISDRFLFTSITFVEIYRKSVIRCCKPLQDIVYYL